MRPLSPVITKNSRRHGFLSPEMGRFFLKSQRGLLRCGGSNSRRDLNSGERRIRRTWRRRATMVAPYLAMRVKTEGELKKEEGR